MQLPLDELGVGVTRHAGEPCHAATFHHGAEYVYVCTNPARHGPDEDGTTAGPKASKTGLAAITEPPWV